MTTYLRNNTRVDQWLEDPSTGIKRKVEADELAGVTIEAAERVLRTTQGIWILVAPIALPPP